MTVPSPEDSALVDRKSRLSVAHLSIKEAWASHCCYRFSCVVLSSAKRTPAAASDKLLIKTFLSVPFLYTLAAVAAERMQATLL